MTSPELTLLLPARSRFAGQPLPASLAKALGRADRSEPVRGKQNRRGDAADRYSPGRAALGRAAPGHAAPGHADPGHAASDSAASDQAAVDRAAASNRGASDPGDSARAAAVPAGGSLQQAQLLRQFDLLPRGWPLAALTRELDAGDARLNAWLRADPAYVKADMSAGRLLAYGELELTADEVEDFLRPLRPVFGDAGFPLSAPVPHRWYLMLPKESKLPVFSAPEDALGDDLYEHMPQGPAARRWRSLLNEAQVLLHNHPRNVQRIQQGRLPVNSLWFHGGGALPDHVRTRHAQVWSAEAGLAALAVQAGVPRASVPDTYATPASASLVDLRGARDLTWLARTWLDPALADLRRGGLSRVMLDFADGVVMTLAAAQRWRLLRRPLAALDE